MSCNDHNNLTEDNATAEVLLERINEEFDSSFKLMSELQLSVLKEVTNG